MPIARLTLAAKAEMLAESIESVKGVDVQQSLGGKEKYGERNSNCGAHQWLPGLRLRRRSPVVVRALDRHVCLHIRSKKGLSAFLSIGLCSANFADRRGYRRGSSPSEPP
jgi:hypothetical protein